MRFLICNYFPYRTAWRLERFTGLAGQNISHRTLTPIRGFPPSRRILKTVTPIISARDHILSARISPGCPHHAVYYQRQKHMYCCS